MSGPTKHLEESGHPNQNFRFNPNPKTITWERLEMRRLQNLGLEPTRYARHFNVTRRLSMDNSSEFSDLSGMSKCLGSNKSMSLVKRLNDRTLHGAMDSELAKVNSVAPFSTVEKPTCGYFFSRGTDNKKQSFGIPPSDLVKWRTFVAQSQ